MLIALSLLVSSYVVADDSCPIYDLSKVNPEEFQDLFTSPKECMIFSFPAGMKIPFKFNIGGELISLSMKETSPLVFQFEKQLYLKFSSDELFLSLDCENWKPAEDFFTGTFSCNFNMTDEGTAFAQYDLVVNVREDDDLEDTVEEITVAEEVQE